MDKVTASRTALRVALRRAAHQVYDSPLVFEDPIAVPILGVTYAAELERMDPRFEKPFSAAMRSFLIARSRYAEENLARAVDSGVGQYVLLGAGLDSFGYRNPYAGLRVFEVDHPATQAWKRELLEQSQIRVPENLTFAPVDFETQSLAAQLGAAGFDFDAPAFFGWLGVVPYLTLDAFRATLGFIADRPAGSGVTLDYGQPREALSFRERMAHDALAARVQLAGEPFRLFFTPAQIALELKEFRVIEDLGAAQINARYFNGRSDRLGLKGSAGRLLCGWR
jgi:methyltransferase (TIGR00027 family)